MYDVHRAAGFNYYAYFSGLDWGMHHKAGFDGRWFGAWPTNDGLTMVAVVCARKRLKEFRQDPEASFQAVFDEVAPDMGAQLRDVGKRETGFVPMRYPDNYYRRAYGPGWALVGDAGYHKDPYSGFGITDAFRQAESLTGYLHQGLSGERSIDDALAEYSKIRDESTADNYALTVTLSELAELPPLLQVVFASASASQAWTNKILGLFAGSVDYQEIFSPDILRKLYDDTGVPEYQRIYSEID